MSPKEGDLRVWHIPQVPGLPFNASITSIEDGRRIIVILDEYDRFQYRNNIKPEYISVNGIQRYSEDIDGELGGAGWIDIDDDELEAEREAGR